MKNILLILLLPLFCQAQTNPQKQDFPKPRYFQLSYEHYLRSATQIDYQGSGHIETGPIQGFGISSLLRFQFKKKWELGLGIGYSRLRHRLLVEMPLTEIVETGDGINVHDYAFSFLPSAIHFPLEFSYQFESGSKWALLPTFGLLFRYHRISNNGSASSYHIENMRHGDGQQWHALLRLGGGARFKPLNWLHLQLDALVDVGYRPPASGYIATYNVINPGYAEYNLSVWNMNFRFSTLFSFKKKAKP